MPHEGSSFSFGTVLNIVVSEEGGGGRGLICVNISPPER